MRQSILNRVAKCTHCGKAFIQNYEGDDETCDYCLAEDELDDDEGQVDDTNE